MKEHMFQNMDYDAAFDDNTEHNRDYSKSENRRRNNESIDQV